jgi:SAM-dependent methyltransferase
MSDHPRTDLDAVRSTWERVGEDDPYWGVLSWEGTEHGQWDLEAFFLEGEREVCRFLEEADAMELTPVFGDALDFGCGVGRLSRALGRRFTNVIGVDISRPMIEQAQRLNPSDASNCRFLVSADQRLPFEPQSFDFVLTNIVLQHMPRRLAENYIGEFIRVLRPGGLAIFQVPAELTTSSTSRHVLVRAAMDALPSGWREEIFRRRAKPDPRRLPMHGIPRTRVLRVAERNGGRIAACVEDRAAGKNWRSFHYFLRRDR